MAPAADAPAVASDGSGDTDAKKPAESASSSVSVAAVADLGGSIVTGTNGNPLAVLARQVSRLPGRSSYSEDGSCWTEMFSTHH